MQKVDAIRAMLDGKKVRQEGWAPGQYLCFDGNYFKDHLSNMATLNHFPSSCAWEIYEEPKRKIKIAPALFKDQDHYWVSFRFFKSEKDARLWGKDMVFIRWLIDTDWEEVEE
jgi:hypothetical protein